MLKVSVYNFLSTYSSLYHPKIVLIIMWTTFHHNIEVYYLINWKWCCQCKTDNVISWNVVWNPIWVIRSPHLRRFQILLGHCKFMSCEEPLICINDLYNGTRCIDRAACQNHPHCPRECKYLKDYFYSIAVYVIWIISMCCLMILCKCVTL